MVTWTFVWSFLSEIIALSLSIKIIEDNRCKTSSSFLCSNVKLTVLISTSSVLFANGFIRNNTFPSSCKKHKNHYYKFNLIKREIDRFKNAFVFFVLWNSKVNFLFVPIWISFTRKRLHNLINGSISWYTLKSNVTLN